MHLLVYNLDKMNTLQTDQKKKEYTLRGTQLALSFAQALFDEYKVEQMTKPETQKTPENQKSASSRRLSTTLQETLVKTKHKGNYEKASNAVVKAIASCMFSTNEEEEINDDVILIDDSDDDAETFRTGDSNDRSWDDDVMIIGTPVRKKKLSKENDICESKSNRSTPDSSEKEKEIDSLTKALELLKTPSADLEKRGIIKFKQSAVVRPLNFQEKESDVSDNRVGHIIPSTDVRVDPDDSVFNDVLPDNKISVKSAVASDKRKNKRQIESENVEAMLPQKIDQDKKRRKVVDSVIVIDSADEPDGRRASPKKKKKKAKKAKKSKKSKKSKYDSPRKDYDKENKKSDSHEDQVKGYDRWSMKPDNFEFSQPRSTTRSSQEDVSKTFNKNLADIRVKVSDGRSVQLTSLCRSRDEADTVPVKAPHNLHNQLADIMPREPPIDLTNRVPRYVVIDGSNVAMRWVGLPLLQSNILNTFVLFNQ